MELLTISDARTVGVAAAPAIPYASIEKVIPPVLGNLLRLNS